MKEHILLSSGEMGPKKERALKCLTLSVTRKQILQDQRIVRRLQFSHSIGKILVHIRDAWCDFHHAYGHDTEECYTQSIQLAQLA